MTTARGHNLNSGEWNDSLTGEFLWSSVNTREAIPDVMTPSTWSLWQIYYNETNPVRLPPHLPFCGNICWRPYLNLSLVVSMYRAVGKDIRQEMHGDIIGAARADLDIPIIPFSPVWVVRTVLPGMIWARAYAGRGGHRVAAFVAESPAWCHGLRPKIAAARDPDTLSTLWRAALKPRFADACRLLRSVTMQFTDPSNRLRLDLVRLVGESGANTLMSNLAGEAGGLESLGPLVGLSQVVRGELSREAYLERYGHRGPHELELFAPGAEDEADWLERQLAEAVQAPAGTRVEALLAGQRAEYAAAWQRFESQHAGRAGAVRRRLVKVAAAARAREAVRSEVARLTRLVRRFLTRAGQLTGLGEGIFFLSLSEMAAALCGEMAPAARIAARRETYARFAALPPYPAIIIGRFDPFEWAADPNRRSDCYDARSRLALPADAITGFAGAAGCVEGIVRRLDCPEQGDRLQPGEILVAVTTNVGWTPIFPRATAIVTDVGAPLSHAAIVARELGIPAVVGCGDATARLRDGDRIRVDGGLGRVEVLERARTAGDKAASVEARHAQD
jgi:pyruvate,water dikinase